MKREWWGQMESHARTYTIEGSNKNKKQNKRKSEHFQSTHTIYNMMMNNKGCGGKRSKLGKGWKKESDKKSVK